MPCQEVSEMMSLELDGALSDKERRSFEAHLAACGECQKEWALFRRINSAYKMVKFTQPPPGLTEAVMARIRHQALKRSIVRGSLLVMGASLLAALTIGLAALALFPLLTSLAQYPFFAALLEMAEGFASVGRVCAYAVELVLGTILQSGAPALAIGYLMLAVGLVIWWTRVLLLPQTRLAGSPRVDRNQG